MKVTTPLITGGPNKQRIANTIIMPNVQIFTSYVFFKYVCIESYHITNPRRKQ